MSDIMLFYTPESHSHSMECAALDAFRASLQPFTDPHGSRLSLFIDASERRIDTQAVLKLLPELEKIDNDVFYCFAIASGRYAKWHIKFFEEILSRFRITIAYENTLTGSNADLLKADIENEKYKVVFGKYFAKSSAKKFTRRHL